MDDEEDTANELGWLETYELPVVEGSEWGSAPLLDEGWDG